MFHPTKSRDGPKFTVQKKKGKEWGKKSEKEKRERGNMEHKEILIRGTAYNRT